MKTEIEKLKNSYKFIFKYCYSFESNFTRVSLAVNNNNILIGDKGKNRDEFFENGKILVLNKKSDNAFNVLFDNIRLHFKHPGVSSMLYPCFVDDDNIIYPSASEENNTCLIRACLRNGEQKCFAEREFIYIYSIKKLGNFIFVVDFCAHTIFQYNMNGDLLKLGKFQGYEFPMDIVSYANGEVVIVFAQKDMVSKFSMYSNGYQLDERHFLKWNYEDDSYIAFNNYIPFYHGIISFVSAGNGNYFIVVGDILYKLDKKFRIIFEVNVLSLFNEIVSNNNDYLDSMGLAINLFFENNYLYVVEAKYFKKILVFEV